MHHQDAHPILGFIRKLAHADEIRRLTDGQLLQHYVTQRDDAAFEVLVHRHGAMVWRVCRSVLREADDAEDAFQATFIILVRRAGAVRRPELLANWLFGVASRVARRARQTLHRHQSRERQAAETLTRQPVATPVPDERQSLLQEELQRLPAKYRAPLVACYLEGQTHEEAARQLQWPVGTVKVRLLRGREMLRIRLSRRGFAVAPAALASLAAESAVSAAPTTLLVNTVKAACLFAARRATATGILSADAVALTEGVLRTMYWTKVTTLTVALITVGLLGAGASWLSFPKTAAQQRSAQVDPAGSPIRASDRGAREDAMKKAEVEELQGTWNVVGLELEGGRLPENFFKGSKIVLQGDRFTTISMGATYKGTFTVDVSQTPKLLDLHFTEGPEKGNRSLCIYELKGDTWQLCLGLTGRDRPREFAVKPGSGHVLETLQRGGEDANQDSPQKEPAKPRAEETGEDAVQKELARLGGEWSLAAGEHAGQPFPEALVKTGKRVIAGNETSATLAGQVILKATFTVDLSKQPRTIDYALTDGPAKGQKMYGIYALDGDTVRFCFAAPGSDRPTDFTTKAGDERTLTLWKRIK